MIKFVEIQPTFIERLSLLLKLFYKRTIRLNSPFYYIQESTSFYDSVYSNPMNITEPDDTEVYETTYGEVIGPKSLLTNKEIKQLANLVKRAKL